MFGELKSKREIEELESQGCQVIYGDSCVLDEGEQKYTVSTVVYPDGNVIMY